MGRDALELNGNKPLRKCTFCGLEANCEEDLGLFVKNQSSKHGRMNACTVCFNKNQSNANLSKNYNISPQDYNVMLMQQNHRCKICERHESEFKKKLHVDHCHDTGKVRGLLCPGCNLGIGKLGDNPLMLLKAVEYLLTAEYVPLGQGEDNE